MRRIPELRYVTGKLMSVTTKMVMIAVTAPDLEKELVVTIHHWAGYTSQNLLTSVACRYACAAYGQKGLDKNRLAMVQAWAEILEEIENMAVVSKVMSR